MYEALPLLSMGEPGNEAREQLYYEHYLKWCVTMAFSLVFALYTRLTTIVVMANFERLVFYTSGGIVYS